MQRTMGLQWVQGGKKEERWASCSGGDRCGERTDSTTTEEVVRGQSHRTAGKVVSGQSHWVYPKRRKGCDLVWGAEAKAGARLARRGGLSLNTF